MNNYIIPANFVANTSLLRGRLDLRKTIDGVMLALLMLPIAFSIKADSISGRIYSVFVCCGPFFALGLAGFGGDSWSQVLVNALDWIQNRQVILYNQNATPLSRTPLDLIMSQVTSKDKLLDVLDERKRKKASARASETYVEGVNFIFKEDTSYDYLSPQKSTGFPAQKSESSDGSALDSLDFSFMDATELNGISVQSVKLTGFGNSVNDVCLY